MRVSNSGVRAADYLTSLIAAAEGSTTVSPAIPRKHLVTATSGTREPRQNIVAVEEIGAPGEIRTPDHLVRSQVLYPAELRARGSICGRASYHNAFPIREER
jgi:hypothetical protein